MSEELFLEGKTYISSKRAAGETGYAQDYIGQLARKGLIAAQRVGGLWYVQMDSLTGYQRNSASYTPTAPVNSPKELDTVITFDGKDYVSAARAAKLTGYNQDYIGQLARGGKVLSRQIGNRWYVDRQMLLSHKSQKDSLLAAVQAESLGIQRPAPVQLSVAEPVSEPLLTYLREDDRDLMPVSAEQKGSHDEITAASTSTSVTPIAIRRVTPLTMASVRPAPAVVHAFPKRSKKAGNAMRRATQVGIALTFVVVLSYGFSTLKSGSVYTVNVRAAGSVISKSAYSAAAIEAGNGLISKIERWIAPELTYERK